MELSELFAGKRPFLYAILPKEINAERTAKLVFIDDNPEDVFISEFPRSSSKKLMAPSQNEYQDLVRLAIETIRNGAFKKVVTSRIKQIEASINKIELLQKMTSAYPHAFIYAHKSAEGACWLGATPELLLHKRGKHYRTVSLAGTQKLIPELALEKYKWGEKEIEEQQLVTDFISTELKNSGCTEVKVSSPFTTAAGNLVHRKSFIEFECDLTTKKLVEILHPTPAICGLPRIPSLEFILKNEPHQRSLYSGVIGFNYPNGDADLFINLRCMRIENNRADIFVGGGITANSIPENEWLETELKSKTLLSLIGL